jgi:hypothetical protein
VVNSYNTNIVSNPEGDPAIQAQRLADREGANYKIIVDYSTAGKDTGFVAIDGQTLTVGSEYLATQTINRNTLRDAFFALLSKPWPIE